MSDEEPGFAIELLSFVFFHLAAKSLGWNFWECRKLEEEVSVLFEFGKLIRNVFLSSMYDCSIVFIEIGISVLMSLSCIRLLRLCNYSSICEVTLCREI